MQDIWPCTRERWSHVPSKKGTEIWIGVERCWPREVSGCTSRRKYTKNSARPATEKEMKQETNLDSVVTNSQTDVKQSVHAVRVSQVMWSIKLRPGHQNERSTSDTHNCSRVPFVLITPDLAYSSHHTRTPSEAQEHFEPSGSKKCTVNLLEHGRATCKHGRPYGNLQNISKILRAKLHATMHALWQRHWVQIAYHTITLRPSALIRDVSFKRACAISSTRGRRDRTCHEGGSRRKQLGDRQRSAQFILRKSRNMELFEFGQYRHGTLWRHRSHELDQSKPM